VWSMDLRASGATEAEEAGAPISAISGTLTHADEKITRAVYLRGKRSNADDIATVTEARQRKRARTASEPGVRIASESPKGK
ncbi:MAG TPA: hypothetical protein VH061_13835, partial [Solirubrobacteraceae bacterium]|nr:hypothetical protein [Solirubrobacteraceae bacterium]